MRWMILVSTILAAVEHSSMNLYSREKDVSPKSSAHEAALPVSKSPDDSLLRLKKANERYVTGKSFNPRRSKALRAELAAMSLAELSKLP